MKCYRCGEETGRPATRDDLLWSLQTAVKMQEQIVDTARLKTLRRVLIEANQWQGQKLCRIEELGSEWVEHANPVIQTMGQLVLDALHGTDEQRVPIPEDPPTVCFHIRPREHDERGLSEVFPGEGYAFLFATEDKLGLDLDIGIASASCDISFEHLSRALAEAGLELRKIEGWTPPPVEPEPEEEQEVDFGGCAAIGVGGFHSDGFEDPDIGCKWCGERWKAKG